MLFLVYFCRIAAFIICSSLEIHAHKGMATEAATTYPSILLKVLPFPSVLIDLVWQYDGDVFELVGIHELKEVHSAYHSCKNTREVGQYDILLSQGIDNRQYFTLEGRNRFGDCPSGWTTATWGSLGNFNKCDAKIALAKTKTPFNYVPTSHRSRYVRWLDKLPEPPETGKGGAMLYSAGCTKLPKTTEWVEYREAKKHLPWVVLSDGRGSDSYYPTGSCEINLKLFNFGLQPT
jgi:hypothetical protein